MGNRFKSSEAYGVLAITPNDTTDLSDYEFRGFIANVAGNIAIEQPGNDTPVVLTINAGTIYPIAITKVNATDTTPGMGIHGIL